MDDTYGVLRPMLELTAVIPAAILCCLPTRDHLRIPPRLLLLAGVPLLLLWAAVGGWLCWNLSCSTNWWLFPWLIVFALLFRRAVRLPGWKSVSVLLGVCSALSFMSNLAIIADALLARTHPGPWFTLPGAAIYAALCWLLLLCLWYPATHAVRWLLSGVEMPSTWYIFWVLPVVFTGLNVFLQPQDYSVLFTGRLLLVDLITSLILMGLMLFLYLLFYLMARGLSHGMRLTRENEILQMQAAQYRSLQKNMEDVRRARHDLRQHFIALQGCVESGDLNAVADYVSAHLPTLPLDSGRVYCRNFALNAVLCHYMDLAVQQNTDMTISVQMEEETVIPEPELCALVGNLLENALEACIWLRNNRPIQVRISQEGRSTLAITVDNPCPQPPQREGNLLLSTKHKGPGFGTQSVRIIAEHYHGDARFEWEDGVFRASVLLNP